MKRARSPAPLPKRLGGWNWLIRGLCFWMKWGISRSKFSRSCCGFCRSGSLSIWAAHNTRKANVRLVAATNRDLEEMVAKKEFRSDLFYRLNVFPIRIPPLRDRSEDIPLLVSYFVQKFAKEMQKSIEAIPAAAMKGLTAWDWPGNIRELENFIERAVLLTRGK